MRLNVKVATVIAVAVAVVAASAAIAFAAAATQSVALQVGQDQGSGWTGTYGTEIVLQPASMTSIELPGDKFHFQVLMRDPDSTATPATVDASGTPWYWKDFRDFEDIQLEDTNTVQPFSYSLGQDDSVILTDGSVVEPTFPYQLRCEYKPGGSTTTPTASFSETETVTLVRNSSTRVLFRNSGAIRHGGTRFGFVVSPNSGIGRIAVTVSKSGMTTKHYTVWTDEDGVASATLKLGTANGLYKVSSKFLGNGYGAASGTTTKYFLATR